MKKGKNHINKYMFFIILFLCLLIAITLYILLKTSNDSKSIEPLESNAKDSIENTLSDDPIKEYEIDLSDIDTSNLKYYLALGDSITYGTSIEESEKNRFSALIEKNLKIESNNYGIDGMTSEWLLSNLKKGDHKKEIKKADLITLSIGSNDVLIAFYIALAKTFNLEFYNNNVVEEIKQQFNDSDSRGKYQMLLKIYDVIHSDEVKKEIEEAYKNYEKNFKNVITYIKKENPKAKIIAVEYYNPYNSITLPLLR